MLQLVHEFNCLLFAMTFTSLNLLTLMVSTKPFPMYIYKYKHQFNVNKLENSESTRYTLYIVVYLLSISKIQKL